MGSTMKVLKQASQLLKCTQQRKQASQQADCKSSCYQEARNQGNEKQDSQ